MMLIIRIAEAVENKPVSELTRLLFCIYVTLMLYPFVLHLLRKALRNKQ